jgi:hypothetical protein
LRKSFGHALEKAYFKKDSPPEIRIVLFLKSTPDGNDEDRGQDGQVGQDHILELLLAVRLFLEVADLGSMS